MDPGELLGRTWDLYRAHMGRLVAIAAAVYVPLALLGMLLALAGWPGLVAANLLTLAAIFLVQGAVVTAVDACRSGGRPASIAEALGSAGGRGGTLAGAGLLAALGIAAGFALLVVPGLILLTWWLVLSPVIMLEGRGAIEAFSRSRELVRGTAWPVFGVALLTLIVLLAFRLALGIALIPLGGVAGALIEAAVANSVAAPFAAVAWTLTYFRLRELEAHRPSAAAAWPSPAA